MEGYRLFDTLIIKVSKEGAWSLQSFTVSGGKKKSVYGHTVGWSCCSSSGSCGLMLQVTPLDCQFLEDLIRQDQGLRTATNY